MTTIQLTAAQADAVAWALDAMADYWQDPDSLRDNGFSCSQLVPVLVGTVLDVEGVPTTVLDDLHYRLVEQLPEMAEDAETRVPSATAAWDRIEAVVDLYPVCSFCQYYRAADPDSGVCTELVPSAGRDLVEIYSDEDASVCATYERKHDA